MARVLVPLPDLGFDVTEVAVPWHVLTRRGHEVVFCTEGGGTAPSADPLLISGLPFGLGARSQPIAFYRELERDEAFRNPRSWDDVDPADYDAVLLPGGHAPGTRQYLGNPTVQKHVATFFELGRPVGAICHGVLVAARSRDRRTGRSVLYERKTTCLTKYQELGGYLLTFWKLGRYYRTYPAYVEDEVKTSLRDPEGQFEQGPITLTARDTETNPDPAWVVEDGNYVSARWPGDAYKFSRTFAELLESGPREPIDRAPIGIEFTETMRGFVSSTVVDDYEAAAKAGNAAGSAFELTLTIASDDLEQLIKNPAHSARMSGTIRAPALSPNPIVASDGVFNLFVTDPKHVDTRLMRYRAPLATEEGHRYLLSGFKTVRNDPGLDLWSDTTTLYVTVYDGDDESGAITARGIVTISPKDFLRQLRSMHVTNATSIAERLEATARFGRYFAGVLYETYGSVFAGPTMFDPAAPPRKKRKLRVPAPQLHPFRTADGVDLLLSRYTGGDKGPVLVAHGLGVSSKIFTIDTIETNLLEFLVAHEYDVWLLDFRASVDLPASHTQFSADDVALQDYPAAVAEVRRLSGADEVQAVVHCFGSTTFVMALLAGLEGVRSAVCSQIAAHVVAPRLTRLKAGLHVPEMLASVGVDSLTAEADKGEGWWQRLYDRALQLYPLQAEEHCSNATCHRITFMYSLLYEHRQLNDATHEAGLHEMFGVANMRALDHLALMVREGKVVSFDGGDAYLPHLDRMAIPIAFIHGAENNCYLPESTELTLRALEAANDPSLYSRHVIPGYGHIDCIFGKQAAEDVYPLIVQHLDAT